MFGRKKQPVAAPPRPANLAGPPGQAEALRVLAAFMDTPPNPPGGTGGGQGFAFNITTMVGPESAEPARSGPPGVSVPVPGMGDVSALQMRAAFQRIEAVVQQVSGGLGLQEEWTVDEVHRALANLDTQQTLIGLTGEQHDALRAAMESMLPP